jgi:uncharacterized SAM-binding protein YcdF (DUF218 family)
LEQFKKLAQRFFCWLGALLVFLSVTPVVPWAARLLGGGGDYNARGDVLVVLSGSLFEPGIMGESSYWRSVNAVLAYKNGGFQKVVVTGGSDPRSPISTLIATFLVASGVPREAIVMETRSDTTRENALFTKDMLAGLSGRKVLLTSDYHMFRALRTFRKAGIEVEPRPFRDLQMRAGTMRGRWPGFISLCIEIPKIVYYAVHGWL